jgi:hypothetical protein
MVVIERIVDPDDAAAMTQVAGAFAALAGRRARLVLVAGGETRRFEGRVARRAAWPAPDDPFLLLRPGVTDRTHVLAAMAIHLRAVEGHLAVARRRHYESDCLDLQRLPAGPVRLRLEELEGEF